MKPRKLNIARPSTIVRNWKDMIDTTLDALLHLALVPPLTAVWLLVYLWLPEKDRP